MGIAYVLVSSLLLSGLGDLFDSTSKDFGNIPRGSVNVHRFILTNKLDRPIHARSVSSSCKCAEPKLVSDLANPGEELVVEVAFNTTTFTGERSMTIFVTFDQPTFESVSLRVRGYSRQDVVFNPSTLDFGVLAPGTSASRAIKIEYAGRADWQITRVTPPSGLTTDLKQLYREPGRVGYELSATLPADAPVGVLSQTISLETNDPQSPMLAVQVTALIEAPLVASPSSVELGEIRVGEKVAKRVLVRGQFPFTIKSIGGETEGVQVKATEGSRKLHVLSIEYSADHPGKVVQELNLRADMGQEEILPVKIVANVVE